MTKSSEMLHHAKWPMITNGLEELSASVCRVKQSKAMLLWNIYNYLPVDIV